LRALFNARANIERADKLVQLIVKQKGKRRSPQKLCGLNFGHF
jgi:hypothetical protein